MSIEILINNITGIRLSTWSSSICASSYSVGRRRIYFDISIELLIRDGNELNNKTKLERHDPHRNQPLLHIQCKVAQLLTIICDLFKANNKIKLTSQSQNFNGFPLTVCVRSYNLRRLFSKPRNHQNNILAFLAKTGYAYGAQVCYPTNESLWPLNIIWSDEIFTKNILWLSPDRSVLFRWSAR